MKWFHFQRIHTLVCAVIFAAVLLSVMRLPLTPSVEAVPFSNDCTFSWNANTESDLAGYRAWITKGGTQGTVVTVPVGATPTVKCSALGVTTDGLYTFSVIAYDNAQTANLSSVASITETKDSVPPDTTITPTITGNTASFVLASSEAGSTFDCELDGGTWVQCTSPRAYAALTDGPHTFTARSKDAAGNTDATPPQYAWTINVQAPTQPSGLRVTANP